MKIKDLRLGQILKDDGVECEVAFIYDDRFEVQYISGALITYRQKDLDDGTIETFIG
jgi:hypothetical protein